MSSVDVVVPCYRYAHYLPMCVESILSQEGVDVRVLIVDDCSPDDTAEVGQRLAASDPRVTYVRNEVNSGLIKTANRGLFEWASADYALLLSADDALSAGALARAAALMDANPTVGFVYGLVNIIGPDARPQGAPEAPDAELIVVPGERFFQLCCKKGNHAPSPTAVVRTRVQHEVGPYDGDFPYTSDYNMWMRFALRGDVGFVNAVQAYYREHGGQMSGGFVGANLIREHLRMVTKLVATQSADFADPDRVLDGYRRFCASAALYEAHKHFEAGNAAGVEEFVALAADHGVPLRELPAWKTLQVKKAIGIGGYKAVRPAIDFLRGKSRPKTYRGGLDAPTAGFLGRRRPSRRTADAVRAQQPST